MRIYGRQLQLRRGRSLDARSLERVDRRAHVEVNVEPPRLHELVRVCAEIDAAKVDRRPWVDFVREKLESAGSSTGKKSKALQYSQVCRDLVRECLAGEKIICLCITEPGAGSDVSNLQCTAKDMGDHFVVDGNKKWITNGIYADYFTVAVRTGPPGSAHKGLSMLLLEKTMPGITVSKMDCMGVWPSGTTYIEFDGVKVPKKNVVGKIGDGFKQVMYNFNHERWLLAGQAARMARTCVEESIAFARSRRTFGKFLIEHQAIQHKIGEMARQCEGLQAWLENVTFQMNTMSKEEQNRKLGGHIALLKLSSSRVAEFCASNAMQVLGGAGYTRSGKGTKVERIYREVKAYAIPGGSEEIMLNLAAGQFGFVTRRAPDPRDKIIKQLKDELKRVQSKM